MTIKQKMIFERFRKVYKEIQTPETIFTKDWLVQTIKRTTSELYSLFPDKNVGQLSCNCFDDKMNTTSDYGNGVWYVDINFHDRITKLPWLICRFYRQNRNVNFYIKN